MNVIIKIMTGDKILDYDSLTDEEKRDIGQRLNHQGLTAMGYVTDGKPAET